MITPSTLKDSDTNVFISYIVNGMRRKFPIRLRFMDKKECFFAQEYAGSFEPPKKRINVTIIAYTKEGVYTTDVKLISANISAREILYNVTMTDKWTFKQLRLSTRKECELPLKIKYDDEKEINAITIDISGGGFSFAYNEPLSSIYERVPCTVELTFPDGMVINFPNNTLVTKSLFVRRKNLKNEFGQPYTLIAYKFIKLTPDEKMILKNFLISLL